MGSAESRQEGYFLEAILCGRDAAAARLLKENPKLANCSFYHGATNPMCRAAFLGHRNIVQLILKYGGDINARSSDQRTPLHWAAWRDDHQMAEFLISNSPDLTAVDKDGWNALDLAIIRINFKVAKVLTRAGLQRRDISEYEGKTWRKYDIQMMFDSIDADVEEVVYDRFFDKIRREREEWLKQDLVVDMRESYSSWFFRQLNFEDPPLVPRDELPVNMQPQNSFRAKIINYMNGIDPRLP